MLRHHGSKRLRRQQATYWAPGAADGFGGETGWASPVPIWVRYEEATDQSGGIAEGSDGLLALRVRGKFYTDQLLEVGGYLAPGGQSGTPLAVGSAKLIVAVSAIPTARADIFINTAEV